jgi:drug/metabolite transporter (DMT)-like permease
MIAIRGGPSTALVGLVLLTVYVLWGSSFAAMKVALAGLPPFLMLAIRWIVAGALLYTWAIWRAGPAGERPALAHWRNASFIGSLVIVGGIGGVAVAEQSLPSGIAALFVSSTPAWAVLISYTVWREGISWSTAAGLALGLAGLVLLVRPTGAEHINPLGAGMAIAAAISWAIGSVCAPRIALPKQPVLSASMQMLAAGTLLLAIALGRGELSRIHWTWEAGAALLYLTVCSSLIGFVAYTWLLAKVPVTVSSTVAYAAPVTAVLVGWQLLGEHIASGTLLATAVIILGVALMITGRTTPKSLSSDGAVRQGSAFRAPVMASDPAYCDCP